MLYNIEDMCIVGWILMIQFLLSTDSIDTLVFAQQNIILQLFNIH